MASSVQDISVMRETLMKCRTAYRAYRASRVVAMGAWKFRPETRDQSSVSVWFRKYSANTHTVDAYP